MPRIVGGRYGLSSKEFTPGMVAGVFEELGARAAPAAVHDRDQRRRLRDEPPLRRVARHRAARHGPRGVLRPRLGRDGRREQEHDQDPRLRGGPARPGLLRLRLEEVRARRPSRTCASGRDRSARPTSSRRRASSAATSSACSSGSRCSAARRDGATLLLNCRARPRAGLGRALAAGSGADPRQARSSSTSIDAGRIARDAGPRRTDQHRAADVLLRDLRRARARAGDRADQGVDRQDLRPARRRGRRSATRRRSTARSKDCTGSSCPTRVTSDARAAAARARATRRSSSARSPRR